jgi:ubiquinone/menaquinone biosynthesis C-methylase UbiE
MDTRAIVADFSENGSSVDKKKSALEDRVAGIRRYWDAHPLGRQYVSDPDVPVGSPAFFEHIRPWMNPYKFSWIMDRIDAESAKLQGKHLLEIGCGMGYDSLEFIRRGVRVTAVDLSPKAVELCKQHFEVVGADADEVKVENALSLSFPDESFDAVWANGVLHHTGDTRAAIDEIFRVLRPGGRAIISHFYRKPSWMYLVKHAGRTNIEYDDEDPPVTDFYTEAEIERMFQNFRIVETYREHFRALPIARSGLKAFIYTYFFRPLYNMLPQYVSERLAYKYSVVAIKPASFRVKTDSAA